MLLLCPLLKHFMGNGAGKDIKEQLMDGFVSFSCSVAVGAFELNSQTVEMERDENSG